jgi:hypothetical protein
VNFLSHGVVVQLGPGLRLRCSEPSQRAEVKVAGSSFLCFRDPGSLDDCWTGFPTGQEDRLESLSHIQSGFKVYVPGAFA